MAEEQQAVSDQSVLAQGDRRPAVDVAASSAAVANVMVRILGAQGTDRTGLDWAGDGTQASFGREAERMCNDCEGEGSPSAETKVKLGLELTAGPRRKVRPGPMARDKKLFWRFHDYF